MNSEHASTSVNPHIPAAADFAQPEPPDLNLRNGHATRRSRPSRIVASSVESELGGVQESIWRELWQEIRPLFKHAVAIIALLSFVYCIDVVSQFLHQRCHDDWKALFEVASFVDRCVAGLAACYLALLVIVPLCGRIGRLLWANWPGDIARFFQKTVLSLWSNRRGQNWFSVPTAMKVPFGNSAVLRRPERSRVGSRREARRPADLDSANQCMERIDARRTPSIGVDKTA